MENIDFNQLDFNDLMKKGMIVFEFLNWVKSDDSIKIISEIIGNQLLLQNIIGIDDKRIAEKIIQLIRKKLELQE